MLFLWCECVFRSVVSRHRRRHRHPGIFAQSVSKCSTINAGSLWRGPIMSQTRDELSHYRHPPRHPDGPHQHSFGVHADATIEVAVYEGCDMVFIRAYFECGAP